MTLDPGSAGPKVSVELNRPRGRLPVLADRLRQETRAEVKRRTVEQIFRDTRLDDQVEAELAVREGEIAAIAGTIVGDVERSLADAPAEPWSEPVRRKASAIAGMPEGS